MSAEHYKGMNSHEILEVLETLLVDSEHAIEAQDVFDELHRRLKEADGELKGEEAEQENYLLKEFVASEREDLWSFWDAYTDKHSQYKSQYPLAQTREKWRAHFERWLDGLL